MQPIRASKFSQTNTASSLIVQPQFQTGYHLFNSYTLTKHEIHPSSPHPFGRRSRPGPSLRKTKGSSACMWSKRSPNLIRLI